MNNGLIGTRFSREMEIVRFHENQKTRKNAKVSSSNADNEIGSIVMHVLWKDVLGRRERLSHSGFQRVIMDRVAAYPYERELWEFTSSLLPRLADDLKGGLEKRVRLTRARDYLKADLIGHAFQRDTSWEKRKEVSMNYSTSLAVKEITFFLGHKTLPARIRSIMDPFCGSGRLITATLKVIPTSDLEEIIIADIMPMAVVIAYTRIFTVLKEMGLEKKVRIVPILGDSFHAFRSLLHKDPRDTGLTDLVIMNPPFTRVHAMPKSQVNQLRKVFADVVPFHGQAGLHVYALVLSRYVLREEGVVISVLPASTVSADYSVFLKEYLLDSFGSLAFLSPVDISSFSDASGFREIIMYGKKKGSSSTRKEQHSSVVFIRSLTAGSSFSNHADDRHETTAIPTSLLRQTKNWMRFFVPSRALELYTVLMERNVLRTGLEQGYRIVRGVEMYGPDFFFLPNKYWSIMGEEEDSVKIKHVKTNRVIDFPREYLVRVLRKPSNYMKGIIPKEKDYAIVIPTGVKENELPRGILKYIELSHEASLVARRKYGDAVWLHHIFRQLRTKRPIGRVFLIDKVGIRTSPTLCYYMPEGTPCTKNFHVFTDLSGEESKLLAAWMNSSLFLFLFILNRREIGGSYGRLQLSDLREQAFFLDFSLLSGEEKERVLRAFDELNSQPVPPLKDQLFWEARMALDTAFLRTRALKFLEEWISVDDLHELLAQLYVEIQLRDKKKN